MLQYYIMHLYCIDIIIIFQYEFQNVSTYYT